MSTRGKTREPEWRAPSDDELAVLRRQIEEAIAEGEAIKATDYEDGWGAWSTNLGDLVARACGPTSRQASSYRYAGGLFADGPDARDMSPASYRSAMVEWRNEKINNYVSRANGTLKAIDQEMQRRGVRTPEDGGATLPAEAFPFVASAPTRAIAQRDYDELRLASRTVKARALLAGSVVEAVLMDALEQSGFTAKQVHSWTFHELITEAQGAKIISDRTGKVANSLRDMRNLVHPAVELREGRLRAADADAAVSLMRLVLEDLR